jgi:hypothetical protein
LRDITQSIGVEVIAGGDGGHMFPLKNGTRALHMTVVWLLIAVVAVICLLRDRWSSFSIVRTAEPQSADDDDWEARPRTAQRTPTPRPRRPLWQTRRFLPARLPSPAVSLALVLMGAVVLRFVGISRQSVWLDEAYSLYLASHPFGQILSFQSANPVHPPLYELLLHLWLAFGSSASSIRALSMLASVATLIPMYALARRLMSPTAALVATGVMSVSAFQVWYAQEARMYALTQLAVLTGLYGFVRFIDERRFADWALFTAALLIGMYLDYSACYVVIALFGWFVFAGRRQVALRLPMIASALAQGLGFSVWLWVALRNIAAVGALSAWVAGADGSGLPAVCADLLFNRTNLSRSGGWEALVASGLGLAALAVALLVPRGSPHYAVLACWLGIPLALGEVAGLFGHPILIARQMLVVQPALFLLLAQSGERIWEGRRRAGEVSNQLHSPVFRRGAILLCLILFVCVNLAAESLSWNTTIKEDWHAAAATVAAHQQANDVILFDAYFVQMPFDYYYLQQDLGRTGPIIEWGYGTQESLLFLNTLEVPQSHDTAAEVAGAPRVWLVVSHAATDGGGGGAAPTLLSLHYSEAHEWSYPGITVELYQAL